MCDQCGCSTPHHHHHHSHHHAHDAAHSHSTSTSTRSTHEVTVLSRVLDANDHAAAHNRSHFEQRGILAINLMSSPGSGKTALLEQTIERLDGRLRVAVIEGDLETENDAQRIRAKGVQAAQITTGTACHLDASMVHQALHALALEQVDLVFIENVGNLVCPAAFDLGQHYNVVLLSVTEGDDKPAKYPVMFRAADLVLLSKSDLLPVLGDFSPAKAEQHLRALAQAAPLLTVSARSGEGLDAWIDWLKQQLDALRAQMATKAG